MNRETVVAADNPVQWQPDAMRLSSSIVWALTVTLSGVGSAAAQAVISVEPRAPAGFPARVREHLAGEAPRRLAAAGVAVRSGADIEVAARAAAQCADAACLHARLGATGARAAARIEIRQSEGGFLAVLEVVSLSTGRSLAREEADCTGCSPQAVAEVALSLIDGVQIPEAEPEAPPAENGGTGPVGSDEVPPDALRLDEPGPRRRRGTSPLVWGALGTGAFFAIGSIPLLLLDGDPTCDGPRQSCPDVYDTQAGGIAAAVGGGVLLVGAVVMWITGWPPGPVEEEAR